MQQKNPRIIQLCLVTLGFSSVFTQVYLLREFMTVFNGNELSMGIVLSNWMLLTGLGAWVGRFISRINGQAVFLLFLQVIFSVLPIITILKIDLWKALVYPEGSIAGLSDIIYSSFLIQLPFCLINGFLFTGYSTVLSNLKGQDITGRAYAFESAGSIVAGLFVTFVFLWFMGTYASLTILMILNLLVCMIAGFSLKPKSSGYIIAGLTIILPCLSLIFDGENFRQSLFFRDQKVIFDHSTPYGSVVITESDRQLTVYENGLPLFSSGNEILNEEMVHYAMVQHSSPKRVLLIGGGISGTLREIRKYSPGRIDYIEMDPSLIKIGREYSNIFSDPSIHALNKDARRFLKQDTTRYDVVLMNVPEPSTLHANRFFTAEFFRLVAHHLNNNGVISVSLEPTSDYVSRGSAELNAVLYNTLSGVFRHVLILPGQRNYFLASDSLLHVQIASMISLSGIETKFVNRFYLDDSLLADRSKFITSHLAKTSRINQDFRPVMFFLQVKYWTTLFKTRYVIILTMTVIILLLVILSLDRITIGLFAGGFTASSMEILFLISFQVIYGYVYSILGLIIAVFMAGLFTGALFWKRLYPVPTLKCYIHIQMAIAIFSLGLPFILLSMSVLPVMDWMIQGVIYLSAFIISSMAGMEFSLAASLREQKFERTAAGNYSADMFGAAAGAIITTIFLFPLLGLAATCLCLVILNAFSALLLYFLSRKSVSL